MSTTHRTEADSVSATVKDVKDGILDSASYAKDRVTAPVSGSNSVDQDMKNTTKETAEEAKAQSKGLLGSISDTLKYAGERLTASPTGATTTSTTTTTSAKTEAGKTAGDKAVDVKDDTKSFFNKLGESAKDQYDAAGNKVKQTEHDVKSKYEETQQTIAEKLATDPIEESRAHGEIPADTATVQSAYPNKS